MINESIKIILVDDHKLVQDGLFAILKDNPRYEIIATAENGDKLLSIISSLHSLPDLVIMDINMPVLNGIDTTKVLKEKYPEIKVLILTMHDGTIYYNKVVAAKADGFVPKNTDKDTLLKAIEAIFLGGEYFYNVQKPGLAERAVEESDGQIELSNREIEVLKLIAEGFSNKEIAGKLGISHRTVDTHRTNLKNKLNVHSIAGLIRYAFKHGHII